jgi:hypothetical protein
LSQRFHGATITYQQNVGTFAGRQRYQQGARHRTDSAFVKNIKPTDAAAGVKYTDGQGLYLHVKSAGQYWRMNYRFTVFRYAIQTGRATYDPAAAMRGAIEKPGVKHRPAMTSVEALESGSNLIPLRTVAR